VLVQVIKSMELKINDIIMQIQNQNS